MKKFVSVLKLGVRKVVDFVDKGVNKAVAVVGAVTAAVLGTSSAHATGGSFPDITTVATDAATLIASLIALGVTILGWKLGSRWIKGIAK